MSVMRSYSQQSAPCFHEDSLVLLNVKKRATLTKCSDLVIGNYIWTGYRWDRIEFIVKTVCPNGINQFAKVTSQNTGQELLVTAWHPILQEGIWLEPHSVGSPVTVKCKHVYSLVLKHRSSTVLIDGQLAITLAHGITVGIPAHDFWGTEKVVEALKKLSTPKLPTVIRPEQVIRRYGRAYDIVKMMPMVSREMQENVWVTTRPQTMMV